MGRRGNGERSIQRPSLRRGWIRKHPFPGLQHVPEALRGDSRGPGGVSRETPFRDAYKAAARIGESVRKLPIERLISQAQRSKLTGV